VTGFDSRHSHQSAGREEFRIQGSGVRSREGEGSLQTGAASAVRPIPANANLGGRAVVPAGAGRGLYIGVAAWAITTRYSLPATFQTPLAWRRCRFGIFAAHVRQQDVLSAALSKRRSSRRMFCRSRRFYAPVFKEARRESNPPGYHPPAPRRARHLDEPSDPVRPKRFQPPTTNRVG
jgi:hypothetical protein